MCRSASLILRCISTCITIAMNSVSLLLPCVCTWVYAHVGGYMCTCVREYMEVWDQAQVPSLGVIHFACHWPRTHPSVQAS